ncbi:MAG TPA: Uma2 family endonuclease [Anaerolineae bacterium]|nr:Uma2 family endonuclease [Anaerolineae bacterium]
MAVQVTKRLFDVREYQRLADAGILSEDDRVELIHGEIVEMSPIGSPHAACVRDLEELLHEKLGRTVHISVQNPIILDDYSEPEPDIALLKRRTHRYKSIHPKPEDVLLVIEVADTSIEYDRLVKIPLYARAKISEAWLVDLNREVIQVFSEPRDGQYQRRHEFRRGEQIGSASIQNLVLGVNDILG